MIQQPLIKWLPLLAASLLLGACAGTGGTHNDATSAKASQDMLKQRAEQRWVDLINKHGDKAYAYLTPGYRKTVSQQQYASGMDNRPIHWKSAKVNKLECAQADKCTVYMVIGYTMHMPGAGVGMVDGVAPLKETWLRLRNQWYYLPREGGGSLKKAK